MDVWIREGWRVVEGKWRGVWRGINHHDVNKLTREGGKGSFGPFRSILDQRGGAGQLEGRERRKEGEKKMRKKGWERRVRRQEEKKGWRKRRLEARHIEGKGR